MMIEPLFLSLILKGLIVFGLLIYSCFTSICIYMALISKITEYTDWIGKYKVYWGVGNICFWGTFFILLVVLKLGILLGL